MMRYSPVVPTEPRGTGILAVKNANTIAALLKAQRLLSNARLHAAELLGRFGTKNENFLLHVNLSINSVHVAMAAMN